jgi:hypothetical protein
MGPTNTGTEVLSALLATNLVSPRFTPVSVTTWEPPGCNSICVGKTVATLGSSVEIVNMDGNPSSNSSLIDAVAFPPPPDINIKGGKITGLGGRG